MSEIEKKRVDRMFATDLNELIDLFGKGYVFDPWLCPKGHPVMTGENTCYWALIRPENLDDPELVAKACPFKQLPVEPAVETPAGYGTVYVAHVDGEDATAPWREQGYVLLHKDHVTSKGTIMTLTEQPEEATA